MTLPERDDSCTIEWNPPDLTLDDLAKFTALLAELHDKVAVPYVTEELFQPGSNVVPPKSPLVTSISMGSPLATQLEGSALYVRMVGLLVKNPEKIGQFIGGFLPSIKVGWLRNKVRIRKEEVSLLHIERELQSLRARGELQATGHSIGRFEKQLARKRELSRTRGPEMGRTRADRSNRSGRYRDDRSRVYRDDTAKRSRDDRSGRYRDDPAKRSRNSRSGRNWPRRDGPRRDGRSR
jgi:hypothetical protein